MKQTTLFLLFVLKTLSIFAQTDLPVLRTETTDLSIKDGSVLRVDYWTIDPTIELDVYVADKINQTKLVTFYSDIDSITFQLAPREQKDFLVILNNKDTCLTRIKSGITFIKSDNLQLTQDSIPFTLTSANNIIIQTVLNKVDTLNLMFHTAQGSISLTEKAVAKIANKSFDKSETAITWGGESTARYSQGNYMRIKGFEWKNVTIWEDKNTGPSADGKFGPSLFQNKVIELNYDQNVMVIHSYLPDLDRLYEKTDILFNQHLMFVETKYKTNRNRYVNKVLIHSGFGGTLLLDDKFVKENNIGDQLKTISESQLTDSHGNVLKTKQAILPCFALGKSKFKDMPISFFQGALGRQHMSVIGGNVLKRFNVFFDLQNAHFYYKPNNLTALPFENT